MGDNNSIRITDEPVSRLDEDRLSLRNYVESLSDFISTCDTPMTISIQGDWGSGKTSIMNMVRENLGDTVYTIMFNTWQYSLFSYEDQLPISLINHLINNLSGDSEKAKQKNKEIIKSLVSNTVKRLTNDIIDIEQVTEKILQQQEDAAEAIVSLKKQFEDLVNEKIKKENVSKVVIFIDDLDRLQPEKALDLIEVIKVFLDCKNCVFVLAIDYDVVSQGIKSKFGESISDEKGKSFFDKIIQLPFRMPIAHFQLDNYLKDYLNELIELGDDDTLEKYERIIKDTIGSNPRGIKRTFNSFKLIDTVADKEGLYNEKNSDATKLNKKTLLFLLICIQLANEKVYNYILDFESINDDIINELENPDFRENLIECKFRLN